MQYRKMIKIFLAFFCQHVFVQIWINLFINEIHIVCIDRFISKNAFSLVCLTTPAFSLVWPHLPFHWSVCPHLPFHWSVYPHLPFHWCVWPHLPIHAYPCLATKCVIKNRILHFAYFFSISINISDVAIIGFLKEPSEMKHRPPNCWNIPWWYCVNKNFQWNPQSICCHITVLLTEHSHPSQLIVKGFQNGLPSIW